MINSLASHATWYLGWGHTTNPLLDSFLIFARPSYHGNERDFAINGAVKCSDFNGKHRNTVHNVRNMLTTKTWFSICDVCLTAKYPCLSLLLPIVFIASFVSAEDSVVEGASCE